VQAADRRSYRWPLWGALVVVGLAAAFLVLPALAGVPARLVEGCGKWIATAGALELLSVLGFVVVFRLVFAEALSWRRSTTAALCALGAGTILPAGGLVGPTIGAWSAGIEKPSLSRLTRSTIAFVLLTAAPGVIVLAALGTLLWLGFQSGPHATMLTLLPAMLSVGLLIGGWLAGSSSRRWPLDRGVRTSRRLERVVEVLTGGVTEAGGW
jgi:hypothetical protein